MRSLKLLFVGATLLAAPGIIGAAPLLQYSFDEASGPALDSGTGTAANANFMNAAVRSSDTPSGTGSSVNFDVTEPPAAHAHLLDGDANKVDGLGAITLTTWLKANTYPSGNHRLISKQAATTFGGFSWNMNAAPNSGTVGPDNFRLGMFLGNNVNSSAGNFTFGFSTDDVDASDWAFLAVTYDGSLASDNTRFYVGGINTPVTQVGNPITLTQLTVDGGDALLGVGYTDAASTADTSVKGLQDDVRVYGEALDLATLDAVRLSNVPEPASLSLLPIAAAGLLARRRRA